LKIRLGRVAIMSDPLTSGAPVSPAETPLEAPVSGGVVGETIPPATGSGAAAPPLGERPAPPTTGPQSAAPPAPEPEPAPEPRSESLLDAIIDLLQMLRNYLRQEAAGLVRDKVVLPVQQLGKMVGFAFAAAFLLALGLGFVAVALLILLAQWLTWPGALGLIGGVLVVGAGFFTFLKVRSTQK
jgi:hypothetical protein